MGKNYFHYNCGNSSHSIYSAIDELNKYVYTYKYVEYAVVWQQT